MLFGLYKSAHEKNIAFKQNEREQRIKDLPEYLKPLTSGDKSILNKPSPEVVDLVHKGELTPREILKAYGKQALRAQEDCNPLTEILIKDSETWADEADTKGSLAGIPVSLKDSVWVEGYDSCIGYSKNVNKPAPEDGGLVKLLKDAGAIPFVKTNIPFTMLSFECYNDIWGTTENPHKKGFIPGGSSGGESCLIAYGGSRIGVGTDVAGSVRLPAHYAGCYSLKPSQQRFPKTGGTAPTPGQEGIPSVTGPMGRTLADVQYFFKAVIEMEPWKYDYYCIPLAWREPQLPKKLKFGVMRTDTVVDPTPACARAVDLAVEAVKKQGHEVVEFTPPDALHALVIGSQLLMQENVTIGRRNMFWGENNDKGVQRVVNFGRLPRFVRRLYAWYVEKIRGDKVWAEVIRNIGMHTVPEVWDLNVQREAYKKTFFDAWNESGIDFLITPPNATPAFVHHGLYNSFSSVGYTFLFNIIDYSAGVMPVTRVDKTKDALPKDFSLKKLNGVAQGAYMNYDAEKLDGLPVGVQVVGRRLDEENVLAAMKVVEDALIADNVVYDPISVD